MDEKLSTQPVKRHRELMAQLNDPVWLKQNAAIEGDGYVEAGNGLQGYVERLKAVTPEAFREPKRQVRALSVLLPVLRDWIVSWELGASFEAVSIEAQSLLFQHIQQASAAQESWIEDLIAAHEQGTRAEHPQAQLQLRERLAEILTQENWQALATVAAQDIEKRVWQRSQTQVETPTAL
ncbi:MAG: hypothetical protein ACFBSF_10315 [Leptolyngbyaceae cyanobacterium]